MSAVVFAIVVLAALTATGKEAFAGGTITIENQTTKSVKVVAPGGRATIEAKGEPVSVAFDTDAEVGVQVEAWWVSEPRQLCQIFTPWGRTVVITGSRTIRCRSH